jgi:hypothetical protein
MASASMGSVFLCLLTSSSFCPSSAYRESLGHSLFPERPFYPFHPGLPRCPGLGATGGRHFPPLPIRERDDGSFYPSPPGGGSRRTRRGPEALPPSSGRPRRGGAAPAFVGASNSSPSAPRVSLGDWETAAANPGGPVSHEAGRLTSLVEKRKYYHLIVLIRSLYIT